MRDAPTAKELVLVGGGHAHVQVLKSFGMRPITGVRLTLIARDVETPYSGMLPGLVAGHYTDDDCHIDLYRLARFAGARLIHAEACGIDRASRQVLCRDRPPIRYDLLSLDIGSTPKADDVPGAAEHTTAVKPVDRLSAKWAALTERIRAADRPLDLAVVGGGAAGVEMTLAMQHHLRRLVPAERMPRFTLVTRGALLAGHNKWVRRAFRRVLSERDVTVHDNMSVERVEAGTLVCADGRRIGFDEALWAVQAGAAPWLKTTGLVLDENGFVMVDAALQSVNDPLVFAAGDVAAVAPYPREKAGVFAVRQGPPLIENLRRVLAGQPPRGFVPQKQFLSLISTGDRYAVASRGPLYAEGAWVWRLKDWIDRRFMRRFQELPAMSMEPKPPDIDPDDLVDATVAMRCGGCGAKVPAGALARALERLIPGAGAPEDAAILTPPADGRVMVQTVDFFRAFVDDPYVFGRIAANHALGDVHAMGADPTAALAIACVPPGREEIVEADLYQMLLGGLEVLQAAGARLVGGHSAEGADMALGFAVTGTVHPRRILRKGGLRPGDRLILTKPLGTGTLLAAAMRGQARARWITAALAAMQQPLGPAAACLADHGATACTDVTGFGLLGHLVEMLAASRTDARLTLDAIPVLDGALDTLAQGIVSTLHPSNAKAGRFIADPDAAEREPAFPLLFDPQTAGGLLAGVPAGKAADCVGMLRGLGYLEAAVIGVVEKAVGREPRVSLRRLPAPEIRLSGKEPRGVATG